MLAWNLCLGSPVLSYAKAAKVKANKFVGISPNELVGHVGPLPFKIPPVSHVFGSGTGFGWRYGPLLSTAASITSTHPANESSRVSSTAKHRCFAFSGADLEESNGPLKVRATKCCDMVRQDLQWISKKIQAAKALLAAFSCRFCRFCRFWGESHQQIVKVLIQIHPFSTLLRAQGRILTWRWQHGHSMATGTESDLLQGASIKP